MITLKQFKKAVASLLARSPNYNDYIITVEKLDFTVKITVTTWETVAIEVHSYEAALELLDYKEDYETAVHGRITNQLERIECENSINIPQLFYDAFAITVRDYAHTGTFYQVLSTAKRLAKRELTGSEHQALCKRIAGSSYSFDLVQDRDGKNCLIY